MMKTTHAVRVLLALSFAACDQNTTTMPAPVIRSGDVLARLHLGPWSYTGFDNVRRQIITDNVTLETTWAALYRGQSPVPPVPAVNFTTEEVVLVAMGIRSSGGYTIEINRVTEGDAGRSIEVREVAPGSGCGVTAALTSPADAMVLPASGGMAVRFVEVRETHDCN